MKNVISLALMASTVPSLVGAQTSGPAANLQTIEVVGRNASGTYHADESSGTKTSLPLRELPQSVRSITRQAMDDLGATRLDDVLDYVGGVSRQNNFGGLWDNVAIRGLPGNENTGMATLLNGFSSNRGFNAPRDLAGVERIEFLKGPAAALYGSSEPGGTLNIVSKRPLWKAAHSAEAYTGSNELGRVALDTTGPLSETFAYRLNVAAENKRSFRDFIKAQREVLAPAFTLKLGSDTLLEYSGEFLRHATPLDRGVVAVNNRLGVVPASRFLGEPGDGNMQVSNRTHQFVLNHEWTPTWRSRFGLSHRETTLEGYSTEATALRTDGVLTRQRRYRDYASNDTGLQAELQGNMEWGGTKHELLVGLESYQFRMDTLMLRVNPSASAPYSVNVYNPVYGQKPPQPAANTSTLEDQRGNALYAQNVISLNPVWRALVGVRFDTVQQSLDNRRTQKTTQQQPQATTPRMGLTWLASDQWSAYVNTGLSFRPNPGSDFAGREFESERGLSSELGVKWESADKRMGATAAWFDIVKKNTLTSDPINSGFSVAAGEVRSRGLEMDLAGQINTHWRLNASMVLNEVEIARDNLLEVGGRLLNVPKVNASMLLMYENALDGGMRYGIGGGLTHTGERLGQARTQAEANAGTPAFDLPSYTTAKLVGYWRLNPKLQITLDVDNLFDREHYTSSFSRVWVTPGSSRIVTVGLQAKF